MLNDPPNLLVCRMKGRPGVLQFVGLENYCGLTGSWGTDAEHRCYNILDWLKGWIKTVKENHLGNFATTVAKQSWNSWRHRGMSCPVLIHDNKNVLEIEGSAYYGARNECRYFGRIECNQEQANRNGRSIDCGVLEVPGKSLYHLDFSWFYPSVMRHNLFPTALVSRNGQVPLSWLRESLAESAVIARVKISSERNTYPVRRKGRLLFASGKFFTTLPGPELQESLDAGDVESCSGFVVYHQADLFTEWVDRLWNLRQEFKRKGDLAGERVVKLIGESLYGKFAQRRFAWQPYTDQEASMPFGEWWFKPEGEDFSERFRSVGWRVEKCCERELSDESFPAISAFITSYARVKLMRAILTAGWTETFYWDTDSLWVTELGLDNLSRSGLVADNELGKLRIVGVHKTVEFIRQKHYLADGVETCSGLPLGSVRMENGQVKMERVDGMMSLISAGGPSKVGVTIGPYKPIGLPKQPAANKYGWAEPIRLEE